MSGRRTPSARGSTSVPRAASPQGDQGQREAPDFRERVLALIARIPPGHVATYGQISLLAGYPRRARHVGNVLANLPPGHQLPWHRVINAQGRVSTRGRSSRRTGGAPRGAEHRQQRLLQGEGVRFRQGRVNLAHYRWEPVVDEAWARKLTRS